MNWSNLQPSNALLVGTNNWLQVEVGEGPLLVSMPHTGTELTPELEVGVVSLDLALTDTDWHLEHLYEFVRDLKANVIRSTVSRTFIDLNRDPAGYSLYPGRATTELCPT